MNTSSKQADSFASSSPLALARPRVLLALLALPLVLLVMLGAALIWGVAGLRKEGARSSGPSEDGP